jgi:hypothetical protein
VPAEPPHLTPGAAVALLELLRDVHQRRRGHLDATPGPAGGGSEP